MDPNACLQAIGLVAETRAERANRAQLCRELMGWLSGGGFEPNWKAHPAGTAAYRAWLRKMKKFSDLLR